MLNKGSTLLGLDIPKDFFTHEVDGDFEITPSLISSQSGKYSYDSFVSAIELAEQKKVTGIVTLPINKKAWESAGIEYVGHTDMLRDYFNKDAIMMLGSSEMYVALFTEHIPLKEVSSKIELKKLSNFLIDLYHSIKSNNIAVLGLNPHAGDGGVLGDEDIIIQEAIDSVNATIGKEVFKGVFVPDTIFTPHQRKRFKYFVAMYHDQGLAPLKALYFEQSINVSLNLPIIRTSVDHGTAYDIAYKNQNPSIISYVNALKEALSF